MAYTDDAVLAKLSALNESHDSIATAAQWFMFHRRHADRTVLIWLQRLKDSPSPKRLNLLYLANEVTQQSKARKKEDFVVAFSPVIADATATAYKGATSELQGKLRRVIDVWKDRGIFETPIQAAIEARIEELDRSRGVKTAGFGGSIFTSASASSTSSSSPAMPQELSSLVAPQLSVTKLSAPAKMAISSANTDYEKLTDPKNEVPSAPVHAARLNGLLKTLASAEGAVANCVKARNELIGALEKLLRANKASLENEVQELETLQSRKATIDNNKQEVEMAIMRGLAASDQEQSPGDASSGSPPVELDRPEVEALTPPHVQDEPDMDGNSGPVLDGVADGAPAPALPQPAAPEPPPHLRSLPPAPGIEILSNLASQYQAVPVVSMNGGTKRRRIDSNEDFPNLGVEGLDEDVAEMLRKDSLGQGAAAGH